MGILTKEALLGATDLVERTVDLRPWVDGEVTVRSLPASYSNDAQSQALEVVTDPKTQKQTARVNTKTLEELQVLHGLVNPRLTSIEEAQELGQKLGPSWRRIVDVIDEISGVSKEAVEQVDRNFPNGSVGTGGVSRNDAAAVGSGGPDLDVRTSA